MASIPDLLRVQVGKETTRGTAVTPTAELTLLEQPRVQPIHESESFRHLGKLAPAVAARVTKIGAGASVSGQATYDDLTYWLDALFGEATPVDNLDGTYTYTYTAPDGSVPSPRVMTMVYGDATGTYQVAGLVGQRLNLEVDGAGPVTFSTDLVGVSVSAGSLQSLSLRSVEPVMGHQAALYIDAWGGSFGTTAINATRFSLALSVDGKTENIYGMSQTPVGYRYGIFDGGLRMSLELGTDALALLNDLLGQTGEPTKRFIRVAFSGPGSRALTIDFAGYLPSAPELFQESEGVVTLDFEWAPMYNDALGSWLKIAVTNTVSVLP